MFYRYEVRMTSKLFGTEKFKYESLDEALEGMTRLARKAVELGDGVKRWFSVRELELEELDYGDNNPSDGPTSL